MAKLAQKTNSETAHYLGVNLNLPNPTWILRLLFSYKILFLDVLFPLSLDKVIFVDADQVSKSTVSITQIST
jgi:hypothetical protein